MRQKISKSLAPAVHSRISCILYLRIYVRSVVSCLTVDINIKHRILGYSNFNINTPLRLWAPCLPACRCRWSMIPGRHTPHVISFPTSENDGRNSQELYEMRPLGLLVLVGFASRIQVRWCWIYTRFGACSWLIVIIRNTSSLSRYREYTRRASRCLA